MNESMMHGLKILRMGTYIKNQDMRMNPTKIKLKASLEKFLGWTGDW
jgi:hypothetical protein